MFKKLFGLAAFAFFLFFSAGTAQQAAAQDLKVGYTDHEVIIVNLPKYKTVQAQLQRELAAGQEEIQGMMANYQEKVATYQKQQALLSADKRQEREQELGQLQQTIQETAQTKEQNLGKREADLMAPLFESVNEAINAVAKEKNLDLVLRAQVGPSQPLLLYVNEDRITNITEDVARRLGIDVDSASAATSNR